MKSRVYSAATCYSAMFYGSVEDLDWHLTWEINALLRVKIFIWLVLLDRCWTTERLARQGLLHAPLCLFCGQEPESMRHLLVGCSISRQLWHELLS